MFTDHNRINVGFKNTNTKIQCRKLKYLEIKPKQFQVSHHQRRNFKNVF